MNVWQGWLQNSCLLIHCPTRFAHLPILSTPFLILRFGVLPNHSAHLGWEGVESWEEPVTEGNISSNVPLLGTFQTLGQRPAEVLRAGTLFPPVFMLAHSGHSASPKCQTSGHVHYNQTSNRLGGPKLLKTLFLQKPFFTKMIISIVNFYSRPVGQELL